MIFVGILIGLILGAGAVLLWAFVLGQRKQETQQQGNAGFHYTTLGSTDIETTNAYLLKPILSEIDKNSLYEIKPRIN